MAESEKVDLGTVQETLLIPLYGRALETAKKRPVLRDAKAVEMVAAIDYDFARFKGGPSPFGTVIRTALFDVWVRSFLEEHPAGTVVEVGAGLNTRFERVDNGQVSWVDLDLPDSMDLRRRFFEESSRRRMIARSVLDPSWVDMIFDLPAPHFFAIEAVLIYLERAEVEKALRLITDKFPGAFVAFDTVGSWIVANQHRHDALKKVEARMTWVCDDPTDLEDWGIGVRLLESRSLSQLPREVLAGAPLPYRMLVPMAGRLRPKTVGRYRINLFEIRRRSRL